MKLKRMCMRSNREFLIGLLHFSGAKRSKARQFSLFFFSKIWWAKTFLEVIIDRDKDSCMFLVFYFANVSFFNCEKKLLKFLHLLTVLEKYFPFQRQ